MPAACRCWARGCVPRSPVEKRVRLGADASARGPQGSHVPNSPAWVVWRAVDGDRDAAGSRVWVLAADNQPQRRRGHSRGRALDPDGGPNNCWAELGGKTLVRIVTEQALESKASDVIVVTGSSGRTKSESITGPQSEIRAQFAFRRRPRRLGSRPASRRCPKTADGAVICLGDMPLISAHLIDRLIEAFAPDRGNLIAGAGERRPAGHPVLWSRRFFNELMTLDGDIGARHLIAKHGEAVAEVPVEGHGAFSIATTPQALEAAQRG